MRVITFAYLLLLLSSLSHAWTPGVIEVDSQADFEAEIKKRKFNGVVQVRDGEKTLINKSFGWSNLEKKRTIKAEENFAIGSITKQFTAVAILQLQEQGVLGLFNSLCDVLPEVKHCAQLTIHHLLTHSSGIADYTNFSVAGDVQQYTSYDKVLKLLNASDLSFEPGKKHDYNNSGYYLLGEIIKRHDPKNRNSYEQYLTEELFSKINKGQISFSPNFYKDDTQPRPYGFDFSLESGLQGPNLDDHLAWAYSAGAIIANTEALFSWNDLLHNSESLLGSDSYHNMIRPYIEDYAYGLMIDKDRVPGDELIWHTGGIPGGYITANIVSKNSGLQSVALSNQFINPFISSHKVASGYLELNAGQSVKLIEIPDYEASMAELLPLVGQYQLDGEYQGQRVSFKFKLSIKRIESKEGIRLHYLQEGQTETTTLDFYDSSHFALLGAGAYFTILRHDRSGNSFSLEQGPFKGFAKKIN